MTTDTRKDCSRCNRGRGEAFWCLKDRYVFDVDKAREFIAERDHEMMELDPDDVRYSVDRCEVNEGHLEHVDPSIPGIVAHIFFPDEGRVVHGHRLIDGHHRAARCMELGIPFPVHVLSEEESVDILIRAPKGARPGKELDQERRQAKQSRKRKKARRKQAKASKKRGAA